MEGKSKKKWILGVLIVGVLVLALIFGSTSSFFGAFKTKFRNFNPQIEIVEEPIAIASSDLVVANDTSIGTGLVFGADIEVYRFTATAVGDADIRIFKLGLDVSTNAIVGADWHVTEYGNGTVQGEGSYDANDGTVFIEFSNVNSDGVELLANSTKTFSVFADVYSADEFDPNDDDTDQDYLYVDEYISTRIHEDVTCVDATGANKVINAGGGFVGLVWTDGTGGLGAAIWENGGCNVQGMPVAYWTMS